MVEKTIESSTGQPPAGVACHRAHPPVNGLDPLQGATAPDVNTITQSLAGSSDGLAVGGSGHEISQGYRNIEIDPNKYCCPNEYSSCDQKKCKICKDYNKSHYFSSSNTGRVFHINSNINLDCNTQNVIYLITCKYCKLQYVGETAKKLKVRFNNHRSAERSDNTTKLLYEHFKSYPCSGYRYSVQIIQKIEGSGHLDNGNIDPAMTQIRQNVEETWINKLQTIFPYGLNDRYKNKDFRNRVETDYIARNYYLKLDQSQNYKRKRSVKACKPQENPESILSHLYTCCNCTLKNELSCASCVLNSIRIKVNSLKKSTAKKLGTYTKDLIFSNSTNISFLPQYYDVLLDRINSKFAPMVQTLDKPTKTKPELVCKINFSNKHIQDIGLPRIFRDKKVLDALPNIVPKVRPTIVFTYSNPIRNKIFNYKETMTNLDVGEFIEQFDNIDCECEGSSFVDKFHKHIITGNLEFVKNQPLKYLFMQGPQFREIPEKTNFKKLGKDLKYQIRKFTHVWSSKFSVPVETFGEWKVKVFQLIKSKLNKIQLNPRRPQKEALKNKETLEYLKKLKEQFVLTPVDKASNNISIICKKFYIKTVLTEVGLWPSTENLTYQPFLNVTKKEVLDNQFKFNQNYKIKNNTRMENLPYIYAIPKFHKTPVKFRYIISSVNCQSKPLAKMITKGLKLCQKQHESWCRVLRSYTGINHFFIIDKNQPILDSLRELSNKSKANSIETFDFSTLYTMIQHDNLLENLNWFIEKAFNGALGKGKTLMAIYSEEAKWVTKTRSTTTTLDKLQFQEAVRYLIENSIFEVGNKLMKQTIGIPMGTDPGPFMANAFLHKYEFDFQVKNRKENYNCAKLLNRTFRYIDDVTIINDKGTFYKYITDIYPPDLVLTKENIGTFSASVLDLDVNIETGKFRVSVFDKTNEFGFDVVKYPSINSNIPDGVLYSVYYSQLLRFLNICNHGTDFLYLLDQLTRKCEAKGASRSKLNSQIIKIIKNRPDLLEALSLKNSQMLLS